MSTRDRPQLERLAEDYQSQDTSAELERADYDDSTVAEPMITTSLRLPKPIMDAIRAAAEARGMRATALMREWIEQQLARHTTTGDQTVPVGAVMAFLAETAARSATNRQAS